MARKRKKADLGPQYDAAIVDSPDRIDFMRGKKNASFKSRFHGQSFTPKETSPGVVSMPIGEAEPSRPQLPERMHAHPTKSKAKFSAKAAANPHDPGQKVQPTRRPKRFGVNDDTKGYTLNRSTNPGYKKV